MTKKIKLKKGDDVIVLTGKDKGKTGKIVKIYSRTICSLFFHYLFSIAGKLAAKPASSIFSVLLVISRISVIKGPGHIAKYNLT